MMDDRLRGILWFGLGLFMAGAGALTLSAVDPRQLEWLGGGMMFLGIGVIFFTVVLILLSDGIGAIVRWWRA